ncbi:hypothetical protein L9F63_023762, partial [Diploptera punctata]
NSDGSKSKFINPEENLDVPDQSMQRLDTRPHILTSEHLASLPSTSTGVYESHISGNFDERMMKHGQTKKKVEVLEFQMRHKRLTKLKPRNISSMDIGSTGSSTSPDIDEESKMKSKAHGRKAGIETMQRHGTVPQSSIYFSPLRSSSILIP